MMGHWQKQTELWVEPVHLGRRIPKDHLLRKINRTLDLSFVRAEVAGFYGSNGNVSVDPVIIVKLMLLLFLDDVRIERELHTHCSSALGLSLVLRLRARG